MKMENLTATIFNIQKFSVNDGPGIRTVVFFKGCPLHCSWCANPESQLAKIQMMHDRKKCSNCHHCMDICPCNAISLRDGHIHIDPYACNGCMQCHKECPNRAITVEGKKMCVEDVMKVVRQDIDFYEESGGGITLSGGEFFMQSEFALELLKQAKKENLHTACETTAFVDHERFNQILPYLDHIFIDIKHWDLKLHEKFTGVPNDMIIQNVKTACASDKTVIVRIPIIPGVNDTLDDAQQFSSLFLENGIQHVQLLPFHQFGENKYTLLDREYAFTDVPAYHKEDLQDYLNVFLTNHIDAYF